MVVTQVEQDTGSNGHKLVLTALPGLWLVVAPGFSERGKGGAERLYGDPGVLPGLLAGVWQGRDGWRSPIKPWACKLSREG